MRMHNQTSRQPRRNRGVRSRFLSGTGPVFTTEGADRRCERKAMTVEDITDAGFVELTGPFRRELLAHCYRMLGSVDDAEDLVQETYLRAWRSYSGFKGQSSERTWLYRIATNACLTALQHRARRPLPSGLADPAQDTGAPPGPG